MLFNNDHRRLNILVIPRFMPDHAIDKVNSPNNPDRVQSLNSRFMTDQFQKRKYEKLGRQQNMIKIIFPEVILREISECI